MILVFGSLNMDLIVPVAHLPRPGETVLSPRHATAPGGKGANQAVAAARAGADVVMVGCVGRDTFGDELLEIVSAAGIDSRPIDARQRTDRDRRGLRRRRRREPDHRRRGRQWPGQPRAGRRRHAGGGLDRAAADGMPAARGLHPGPARQGRGQAGHRQRRTGRPGHARDDRRARRQRGRGGDRGGGDRPRCRAIPWRSHVG